MKHIGLLKAIKLTSSYNKLSQEEREKLKKERLYNLVHYAKNNSPYFKRYYTNIGDDFKLTDLPVTNKVNMMEHFDDWVTNREVHMSGVKEFMKNPDNIGRSFMKKYFVYTTSGSTGNPSVVLYDKTAKNIMDAVSILRSYARKEDMKKFIKKGGKSAAVYATGGFYLGVSTVRSKLLKMPWKKKQIMIASILDPVEKIVEQLNAFQPVMLGGYPTALELLAEEKKKGNLKISPMLIMTGGEYLSKELRKSLTEIFQCYVQTNYACTEGGMIACECKYEHFHINDDWIIAEPVDKDYNPVPDGVQADKWLLTNLTNYTQPFIRYEITDRIIYHTEECACHNPSPWIEIEGRTDDILNFEGENGTVRILPLALYAILKEIHGITRFQLILRKKNVIELRLICKNGEDRQDSFTAAKDRLIKFMDKRGISHVSVYLSEEEPKVNNKSGKFKHIYQEKED